MKLIKNLPPLQKMPRRCGYSVLGVFFQYIYQ
jgi:hypothetical protein